MTLDQAAHLMDAVALGESGFHPSDKLVKRLVDEFVDLFVYY